MTAYRNGRPVYIPAKVIGAYQANLTRNARASHYVPALVYVQGRPTGFELMILLTYRFGVDILGHHAEVTEAWRERSIVDFHEPLPESWFIDLNQGEIINEGAPDETADLPF